jgi:hypothetical protein
MAQDGGCRPGDTLCDPPNPAENFEGWCADLKTDPSNCGACNVMCGGGFGRCINGYCPSNDPNACEPGWKGCEGGPTGAFPFTCTDLQNDPANCGMCFSRCRPQHSCKGGECVPDPDAPELAPEPWLSCQKGFNWCDGTCTNPLNDNMNCGSCRKMVS